MIRTSREELIAFEDRIFDLFEAGELPYLVHICGGQEDQLLEIFEGVDLGDYVFSTHRTHYHYLCAGGHPDDLEAKIRAGDSMFVYSRELNFFSSSILAGCAGIAAGVAMSIKMRGSDQHVWCFIGDGAEDEGHFYEAVMFVHGHNLPCTFIVEDNDRSVATSKVDRRGTETPHVWPPCVKRYYYEPTYPHASTGSGNVVAFKQEVIDGYLKCR